MTGATYTYAAPAQAAETAGAYSYQAPAVTYTGAQATYPSAAAPQTYAATAPLPVPYTTTAAPTPYTMASTYAPNVYAPAPSPRGPPPAYCYAAPALPEQPSYMYAAPPAALQNSDNALQAYATSQYSTPAPVAPMPYAAAAVYPTAGASLDAYSAQTYAAPPVGLLGLASSYTPAPQGGPYAPASGLTAPQLCTPQLTQYGAPSQYPYGVEQRPFTAYDAPTDSYGHGMLDGCFRPQPAARGFFGDIFGNAYDRFYSRGLGFGSELAMPPPPPPPPYALHQQRLSQEQRDRDFPASRGSFSASMPAPQTYGAPPPSFVRPRQEQQNFPPATGGGSFSDSMPMPMPHQHQHGGLPSSSQRWDFPPHGGSFSGSMSMPHLHGLPPLLEQRDFGSFSGSMSMPHLHGMAHGLPQAESMVQAYGAPQPQTAMPQAHELYGSLSVESMAQSYGAPQPPPTSRPQPAALEESWGDLEDRNIPGTNFQQAPSMLAYHNTGAKNHSGKVTKSHKKRTMGICC
eukprot:NODE_5626_length_1750_cov_5.590265.p1 GENE.NODE_5626_length_1750_cov_5.590265~~NODE_5626_length_1750_cov_5.590265.p1  ORF type:complete len:572 (+),score=119.96 NODE_5626_length_1750_cov_5.590265:174-1718(+)